MRRDDPRKDDGRAAAGLYRLLKDLDAALKRPDVYFLQQRVLIAGVIHHGPLGDVRHVSELADRG